MRWTVKLELVRDDGITAIHLLATITRPIADLQPEEIGLTMEEGRALVQDVERVMIADVDITFLCHLISVVAAAEDFSRP